MEVSSITLDDLSFPCFWQFKTCRSRRSHTLKGEKICACQCNYLGGPDHQPGASVDLGSARASHVDPNMDREAIIQITESPDPGICLTLLEKTCTRYPSIHIDVALP